ncbi:hypothetical protein [Compostimonas suwonensis]|uniref:Uncharacterized protein n=1 Tax=Compostimonas suwonensis TaxID=1048394 RepID=A0A2M9C4A8_9MICO|nr:hypothetical protein [Compostimonas suwonensis]PJJ65364.1 hypothetical protein CLV54_0396 [Compostimonas suwonensis]
MTLTHIIPSLRRSIPEPLVADRWPEHTVASTTDVTIAGVSLIRLVELCDTPCVHTAAAVIPGTGGRPSPTADMSVVVSTVLSVERSPDGLVVVIDAEPGECDANLAETRLLGRVSTAKGVPVRLSGERADAATAARSAGVGVGADAGAAVGAGGVLSAGAALGAGSGAAPGAGAALGAGVAPGAGVALAELPVDLRPGDLVAFPCRGVTCHRAIAGPAHHADAAAIRPALVGAAL